jgi:hypothetical protein
MLGGFTLISYCITATAHARVNIVICITSDLELEHRSTLFFFIFYVVNYFRSRGIEIKPGTGVIRNISLSKRWDFPKIIESPPCVH